MTEERATYSTSEKPVQPIYLDGIGTMIEGQHRYDEASALCLLSLAYSAERQAAALERIADELGRGITTVPVNP